MFWIEQADPYTSTAADFQTPSRYNIDIGLRRARLRAAGSEDRTACATHDSTTHRRAARHGAPKAGSIIMYSIEPTARDATNEQAHAPQAKPQQALSSSFKRWVRPGAVRVVPRMTDRKHMHDTGTSRTCRQDISLNAADTLHSLLCAQGLCAHTRPHQAKDTQTHEEIRWERETADSAIISPHLF